MARPLLACRHVRESYSPTLQAHVCPDCFAVRPGGQNKYHARSTDVDGIRFASQAEATHYQKLRDREQRGEISGLTLQPNYRLVVNGVHIATYRADFTYFEADDTRVVCDVKGMVTREYRMKRALMRALFGIEILEVRT